MPYAVRCAYVRCDFVCCVNAQTASAPIAMSVDADGQPYVLCTCCKEKTYKGVSIFLLLLGIASVGVAVFFPPYIDRALDQALTDKVTITAQDQADNSDEYVAWSDPTSDDAVPIWYKVYVWNTTNPTEVLKGEKPILQEIGPYVYRDMKAYFNITFGTDEQLRNTMTYRIYEYFLFQRDQTDAALDPDKDFVYSPNMAYQALIPRTFTVDGIIKPLNEYYFKRDDMYKLWGARMRSVNEVLFGYNDTEMWAASQAFGAATVPPLFPGVVGNDTSLTEANVDITGTHLQYTLYTGESPHEQLLRTYKAWNDMGYLVSHFNPNGFGPAVGTWRSPSAQMVWGTDGTQFRRNLQKGMVVTAFVDELFRAAPLQNAPATDDFYTQTVDEKGITLYRFTMPPDVTLNATHQPANWVYDAFGPDGLANLTIPKSMNIFVSKPHFQDGDAGLRANLTGMTDPVRALHDTYVDAEPLTGIVMNAAKRLQANIWVTPTPTDFDGVWLKSAAQVLLPIFWAEQSGSIPNNLANEFVGSVYLAQSLAFWLRWIGFFAGAALCVAAFVLLWAAPAYFPSASFGAINAADAKAPIVGSGHDVNAQAPVYNGLNDGDDDGAAGPVARHDVVDDT